jgi:hypothetical protein
MRVVITVAMVTMERDFVPYDDDDLQMCECVLL